MTTAAVLLIASCSSSSSSDSNSANDGGSSSPTPSPSPGDDAATATTGADGDADASMAPWVTLFDGTLTPDWQMSTIKNQPGRDDPGHFSVEAGGELVSHPGTDLGLLWNTKPTPPSFVLEMDWKLSAIDDNSGVFLRFPNIADKGYDSTAWVAINFGFEVQINEPGVPDGASQHTTGAIYAQTTQTFTRVVAKPPGEWNAYSIRVDGHSYTVTLNGQQVTHFVNTTEVATRGLASTPSTPAFIGLQTHTGSVAFRNIRIRALP